MVDYPSDRQNSGYAVRYLRWLMDSGIVNEVGPDGIALLTAVVTVEDQLHYCRPPTFYNEQLQSRCGMRSTHTLIAARERTVRAGLLNYRAGAKRRPGRYFTVGFSAKNALQKMHCKPKENRKKTAPSIPNTRTQYVSKEKKPRSRKSEDSRMVGFDRWYEAYPKHVSRGKAMAAYPKAVATIQADRNVDESTAAEILLKLTLERLPMLTSRDEKFIPHPSSWLNAQGYWDKPTASSSDDEFTDFTNVQIERRKRC
jgi:hypothetical protein